MSITFDDLFKQKQLLDESNIEPFESLARLRISRGYYANFTLANYIVNNFDIPLVEYNRDGKRLGSHQVVSQSLIACKNKHLKEIGHKLKKISLFEKNADYKIDMNISDYDISQAERYYQVCQYSFREFLKK